MHCRFLRWADDIRPLCLKNRFALNLFYLLDPKQWNEIPPKIKNCWSLRRFKIRLKNILLNNTKHNSLDLVHSQGYSDWLASCLSVCHFHNRLAYSNFFNLPSLCNFLACFILFFVCIRPCRFHESPLTLEVIISHHLDFSWSLW